MIIYFLWEKKNVYLGPLLVFQLDYYACLALAGRFFTIIPSLSDKYYKLLILFPDLHMHALS